MSQENVETVRALIEGFRQRDTKTIEALFAPEIERDTTCLAEVLLDLAGVHQGVEGTRTFWRTWLSPWRDVEAGLQGRPEKAELARELDA